jgi:hypothetical protein
MLRAKDTPVQKSQSGIMHGFWEQLSKWAIRSVKKGDLDYPSIPTQGIKAELCLRLRAENPD